MQRSLLESVYNQNLSQGVENGKNESKQKLARFSYACQTMVRTILKRS